MVATAGFTIFICGNRLTPHGRLEPSPGVFEEFELARAAGAYPLPIGSTGWAAGELWKMVDEQFSEIFPRRTPRRPFRALQSPNTTPDEAIDALMTLIRYLQPH